MKHKLNLIELIDACIRESYSYDDLLKKLEETDFDAKDETQKVVFDFVSWIILEDEFGFFLECEDVKNLLKDLKLQLQNGQKITREYIDECVSKNKNIRHKIDEHTRFYKWYRIFMICFLLIIVYFVFFYCK